MIELWKPIMNLVDINKPIIFNDLGQKIEDDKTDKGIIPFVIFYDDETKKYWYARSRSAVKETKKGIIIKKQLKSEIYVKHVKNGGLFTIDSYVDCSKIYVMDKDELESLIDFESGLYKKIEKLDAYYIQKIKDEIKSCVFGKPPYLSIINVYIEDDKTKAKSLYLCDEKLNRIERLADEGIIELDYELENNLFKFDSNKSKYSYHQNRFDNGMEFCLKFLDEYFPKDINNFVAKQDIDLKDYENLRLKNIENLAKNNKIKEIER